MGARRATMTAAIVEGSSAAGSARIVSRQKSATRIATLRGDVDPAGARSNERGAKPTRASWRARGTRRRKWRAILELRRNQQRRGRRAVRAARIGVWAVRFGGPEGRAGRPTWARHESHQSALKRGCALVHGAAGRDGEPRARAVGCGKRGLTRWGNSSSRSTSQSVRRAGFRNAPSPGSVLDQVRQTIEDMLLGGLRSGIAPKHWGGKGGRKEPGAASALADRPCGRCFSAPRARIGILRARTLRWNPKRKGRPSAADRVRGRC